MVARGVGLCSGHGGSAGRTRATGRRRAIVNTSSIGSRRASPALPAYGAMKRALNSLTETAAVNWAPGCIRGDGITPGGPSTEMLDGWEAAAPGIIEQMTATIPLGRMVEPRQIAEVAAWLLSDRASYVTRSTAAPAPDRHRGPLRGSRGNTDLVADGIGRRPQGQCLSVGVTAQPRFHCWFGLP